MQVCLTALAPETREHAFGNLRAIPDDAPRYVVTLNDIMLTPEGEGIHHLNLEDYLLAQV